MSTQQKVITNSEAFVRVPGRDPMPLQQLATNVPNVQAFQSILKAVGDETETGWFVRIPRGEGFNGTSEFRVNEDVFEQIRYLTALARYTTYLKGKLKIA